jgi:hypothetical protein
MLAHAGQRTSLTLPTASKTDALSGADESKTVNVRHTSYFFM